MQNNIPQTQIVNALLTLVPGAQWNLLGDTLDKLIWLDTIQVRPTDAAINAQIAIQGK